MPITLTDPFKGRHFPGEVIVLCVRWYLRYPLAYEHITELLAERGVEVDHRTVQKRVWLAKAMARFRAPGEHCRVSRRWP